MYAFSFQKKFFFNGKLIKVTGRERFIETNSIEQQNESEIKTEDQSRGLNEFEKVLRFLMKMLVSNNLDYFQVTHFIQERGIKN